MLAKAGRWSPAQLRIERYEQAQLLGGTDVDAGIKATLMFVSDMVGTTQIWEVFFAQVDSSGHLAIVADLSDVNVQGWSCFREAMNRFGSSVKVVRGTWVSGIGLEDNLILFNKAMATGKYTLQEAAFQTHTGRWASGYEFSHVRIVEVYPPSKHGPFERVRVEFVR